MEWKFTATSFFSTDIPSAFFRGPFVLQQYMQKRQPSGAVGCLLGYIWDMGYSGIYLDY